MDRDGDRNQRNSGSDGRQQMEFPRQPRDGSARRLEDGPGQDRKCGSNRSDFKGCELSWVRLLIIPQAWLGLAADMYPAI